MQTGVDEWMGMGWEWDKSGKISYLTIPKWSEWGIKVAFSTLSSFNMGLHVNDNPENVVENRKRFLSELEVSPDDCVIAEQVHGHHVHIVTEKDKGRGMFEMSSAIPECDGMVTMEKMGLMCFFADCVPIYFYCPQTGMIGIAHAGWKGTAQKIVKEVLNRIESAGGSPETCYAAIGPCIGACCYEVDENVASIFRENFNNHDSILIKIPGGKYKLNLLEANRALLTVEGILPENIYFSEMCTSCHSEAFYSYRRDGMTGRMAALIIKKKGDN